MLVKLQAWVIYILVMLLYNSLIVGVASLLLYMVGLFNTSIFYLVPIVSLILFFVYDLGFKVSNGELKYQIDEIQRILRKENNES